MSASSQHSQDCGIGSVEGYNEEPRARSSGGEALRFALLAENAGWPLAEAQVCGCGNVTDNGWPMNAVGASVSKVIDLAARVYTVQITVGALSESEYWHSASLDDGGRFPTMATIEFDIGCHESTSGMRGFPIRVDGESHTRVA